MQPFLYVFPHRTQEYTLLLEMSGLQLKELPQKEIKNNYFYDDDYVAVLFFFVCVFFFFFFVTNI